MQGLRVAVIGDFCLDIYLLVDDKAGEVSIETGLVTKPVFEQRFSLGGAGNVAANLAALDVGSLEVYGVVGDDPYGREMHRILETVGADHSGLCIQTEGWQTCAYTKIYHGAQEEPRVDFGNFNRLDPRVGDALLEQLGPRLDQLDVVIINQQLINGIHSKEIRSGITKLISSHPEVAFITDSRDYCNEFHGTIRKINVYEGAKLCGVNVDENVGFEVAGRIARELHDRWKTPLFMTRGEFGALVVDDQGTHEIPGLLLLEELDTVGAGDSMLSGIAAGLGAGASPVAAAQFGSFAAGVTVQKLRTTGTARPAEIRELANNAAYAHNPELALHVENARYLRQDSRDIEIVGDVDAISRRKGLIRHVIFDHDGTISVLREGWPQAMETVMMKAILGPTYSTTDGDTIQKVRQRILKYIDQTTGVQTLVQMHGLVDLVIEFGFIPDHEIRTAEQYKEIYNTALMDFVEERIAECERDRDARGGYIVPGAVDFLESLHSLGIHLYLASGTDKHDVEREARVLGYADLFTAIVGAKGDVTYEPKQVALKTILESVGDAGSESVAIVGDGPVEIREARRFGALAVGVASDEVHPGRLSTDKRRRLILAGADLIVADFRSRKQIMELVF